MGQEYVSHLDTVTGQSHAERFNAARRMISVPRFAEPEEIAHAVLFFLKEESSYITGTVLDVDGGFGGYEPYRKVS